MRTCWAYGMCAHTQASYACTHASKLCVHTRKHPRKLCVHTRKQVMCAHTQASMRAYTSCEPNMECANSQHVCMNSVVSWVTCVHILITALCSGTSNMCKHLMGTSNASSHVMASWGMTSNMCAQILALCGLVSNTWVQTWWGQVMRAYTFSPYRVWQGTCAHSFFKRTSKACEHWALRRATSSMCANVMRTSNACAQVWA